MNGVSSKPGAVQSGPRWATASCTSSRLRRGSQCLEIPSCVCHSPSRHDRAVRHFCAYPLLLLSSRCRHAGAAGQACGRRVT